MEKKIQFCAGTHSRKNLCSFSWRNLSYPCVLSNDTRILRPLKQQILALHRLTQSCAVSNKRILCCLKRQTPVLYQLTGFCAVSNDRNLYRIKWKNDLESHQVAESCIILDAESVTVWNVLVQWGIIWTKTNFFAAKSLISSVYLRLF